MHGVRVYGYMNMGIHYWGVGIDPYIQIRFIGTPENQAIKFGNPQVLQLSLFRPIGALHCKPSTGQISRDLTPNCGIVVHYVANNVDLALINNPPPRLINLRPGDPRNKDAGNVRRKACLELFET